MKPLALNLDPLWGSELLAVNLDLLRQRLELSFCVNEGQDTELFRLTCDEVTAFRYVNNIPGPWAYADATEAEAEDLPDGGIRIRVELWSDPSGIIVEAARAALEREQLPD